MIKITNESENLVNDCYDNYLCDLKNKNDIKLE